MRSKTSDFFVLWTLLKLTRDISLCRTRAVKLCTHHSVSICHHNYFELSVLKEVTVRRLQLLWFYVDISLVRREIGLKKCSMATSYTCTSMAVLYHLIHCKRNNYQVLVWALQCVLSWNHRHTGTFMPTLQTLKCSNTNEMIIYTLLSLSNSFFSHSKSL